MMNTLGPQLHGKNAFFLRSLLLLLIDIFQEILFHDCDLRDWRLFSTTTLATFPWSLMLKELLLF